MYKIKEIHIDENWEDTMEYIESKRNWNVEKQCYRNPDAENCKAKISDCDIYWRGKYLIVEYDGIIPYWEHKGSYCFLKQAIDFMELDSPAKWKTIDKLISLRMAIRQTEVNWCGFVDELLVGKKMTFLLYQKFMKLARAQDLEHHGTHTF